MRFIHNKKYQKDCDAKSTVKSSEKANTKTELKNQLCKMTPSAYHTRCYRNKFHSKLNSRDQAILNKYKPQFSKLLSRGPKFVPTGKSLSKKRNSI